MNAIEKNTREVMQVCRNGHVITDLLATFPERSLSHCDRCGADTLTACLTCGQELPGAIHVPEAFPIGETRPPEFCSACGAAFPWTERKKSVGSQATECVLESLLRALPRVARELRNRRPGKPEFKLEDVQDLEDLVRALLPLHFDDIRPERRTPSYAETDRTDFVLGGLGFALTCKLTAGSAGERELTAQLYEDIAYYRDRNFKSLFVFVHDPEASLRGPRRLEATWNGMDGEQIIHSIIAS